MLVVLLVIVATLLAVVAFTGITVSVKTKDATDIAVTAFLVAATVLMYAAAVAL